MALLVEIVKVSDAPPVLVRTKVWADDAVPLCTLPKSKLVGVNETEGTPPTPVSVRMCGFAESVADNCMFPARAPAAVGQNFALCVQEAPAAIVAGNDPQFPVPPKAKSPEFVPPMTMPVYCSDELPVFVNSDVFGELHDPTGMVPKSSVEGVRVSAADPPLPVRGS